MTCCINKQSGVFPPHGSFPWLCPYRLGAFRKLAPDWPDRKLKRCPDWLLVLTCCVSLSYQSTHSKILFYSFLWFGSGRCRARLVFLLHLWAGHVAEFSLADWWEEVCSELKMQSSKRFMLDDFLAGWIGGELSPALCSGGEAPCVTPGSVRGARLWGAGCMAPHGSSWLQVCLG